jgi:hypothetical protein
MNFTKPESWVRLMLTLLLKNTVNKLLAMDQILLKIGKAIKDYYNQVNTLGKTEEEFSLWIESLEEPMKSNFKSRGI